MSIALIDVNNFYASCEQVINPSLRGHPLVILSNNDGCIIARNAEARSLGIAMGVPYFKARQELEKLSIEVRSSNYELYGDMSQRLISLLRNYCEELEIYSIDEAFVQINRPASNNLYPWASHLQALIYKNLGLPISIGIGASKCQAKLANYLAKIKDCHAGIFDIENTTNQEDCLESISIENVWGVGRKLAYWYRLRGINNARQLRDMPSNQLRIKHGIVGIRIQQELRGKTCLPICATPPPKRETCVSRSFGYPVTNIKDLRQAIACYVVCASEKLRRQKQLASTITVFVRTSSYTTIFYSQSATKRLDIPTSDTAMLLSASLPLTKEIFKSDYPLMKAGVIMQGLLNNDYLQLTLSESHNSQDLSKKERLMRTIDNLNKRYGNNTIKWAICGMNQSWRMRRKHLTAFTTTRLKDIPIVQA